MKKFAFLLFLFSLCVANLRADDQTAAVQQALKDQGFYYGQVDGQPGPETTAAIRRYQIRNGLQVDGTLNKETLDSLKIAGSGNTTAGNPQLPPPPAPLDGQQQPAPQPPPPQNVTQNDREFLNKQNGASTPAGTQPRLRHLRTTRMSRHPAAPATPAAIDIQAPDEPQPQPQVISRCNSRFSTRARRIKTRLLKFSRAPFATPRPSLPAAVFIMARPMAYPAR